MKIRSLLACTVIVLCGWHLAAVQAQVRYFAKPPSPEQLLEAMTAAGGPANNQDGAAASGARRGPGGRSLIVSQPLQDRPELAAESAPGRARPNPNPGPDIVQASGSGSGPAAALPINFDLGSAKVMQSSYGYVDAIAMVMQRNPAIQMVIEGHTDVTGPSSRNMMLSWDRAFTVFKLLVERYGIDPARLQPVGRGSLEPMPGIAPDDGTNRRVQFRITTG